MIIYIDPIAKWTGFGLFVGAVLMVYTKRYLVTDRAGLTTTQQLGAAPITAIGFGLLAWKVDSSVELLAYSYLAAVGVAASTVDLIEHRLPNDLILPGYAILGTSFAISASQNSDMFSMLRAVMSAALLTALYFVVALLSRGGLGAGDVKLGALLGLSLGWLGWSAVVTATLLSWLFAAAAVPLIRNQRSNSAGIVIPMGPFLFFGFLAAVSTS